MFYTTIQSCNLLGDLAVICNLAVLIRIEQEKIISKLLVNKTNFLLYLSIKNSNLGILLGHLSYSGGLLLLVFIHLVHDSSRLFVHVPWNVFQGLRNPVVVVISLHLLYIHVYAIKGLVL